MNLQERSYSTDSIRPRPFIVKSQELDMLVVLTVWGDGSLKERIADEITKFVFAAQGDVEVTSPFEMNSFLTRDCNLLRMAALIANDLVYRSENRDEYRSCYEAVILYKNDSRLSWLQIGYPNLYLIENQILPLSVAAPLKSTASENNSINLPQQYLGTEMHCHFQLGDIVLEPETRILLHSDVSPSPNSWVPPKSGIFSLEDFFKSQIQFSPENPFWAGVVDFNDSNK